MNTRTMESSSRLIRRLLIFVWVVLVVGASGANAAPVKTLVRDTLYRADGSAAQGSVTIRWNGFSTSAGEAVTSSQMTVMTDANGGISIPLIPNTGSSPSGSYYRVVIKLDDGTTSEEMWVVPVLTTTTVAAIRAKVVPQAVAAQFASRDYLDSALAGLATVASTGNYNDLANKPANSNLAAPGSIGSLTPGPVNATVYAVNGTPLASGNLSDATTLARNNAGNTFAANQVIAYSGADGVNPLLINAATSGLSSAHGLNLNLPGMGNHRAIGVVNGTDSVSWFSLTGSVNSSGCGAGFEFGPGGSTARDTFLCRSSAGTLYAPGALGVGGAISADAVTARSVNGVPSVLGYGAKCDGATNDSAAFAAADALGVAVQIPPGTTGACVIAANITLNSQWIIPQGALVSPSTGVTVTMAHTPQAGLYQIFTGAGQVQFANNDPVVYPEWWGAVPTVLGGGADTYAALVSACNSLPYLSSGTQYTYTGQIARTGTIKFRALYYLISHPWTCSYGVAYTIGDNPGGVGTMAMLELQSGAVPSVPATETFAWFIDPPSSGTGGNIHSNLGFGTRVNGVGVSVDGNKQYSTTLTAAISSTGSQTVTVGSTTGMATSGAGSQVWIGTGADFEIVTPTSITDSTHFVATLAYTHSSAEPVVTFSITNYVSGLYSAQAQGSSVRNTGSSHAWGHGCVFALAPTSTNPDHLSCASTLAGPNVDLAGVGAFDFVDSGNNNMTGMLGQVEFRGPSSLTSYQYTIPAVGAFVAGSSRVVVVSSYNGNYQNCGPSFCTFTKVGSSPAAGQYVEGSTGILTFNSADQSQFFRVYYQDTSPITASASTTAAEPVPSVQIEANADVHINQMFCEGSYDCLNTYKVWGLSIDYLEAHPTTQPANTAAVFVDQFSNNVLLPKQKYFFYGSNQWTWGVNDRMHGVARTLVTDANADSYARDTYSPGYLAVPASGTPPSGMVAATPGLVYPDGVTIAESTGGQISAAIGTTSHAGAVKPDGSTITVDGDGTIHAASATESVVATVNLTGLSAGKAATTIYAVPSGGGGWYKVGCYVVETQAATTSSTLPQCVAQWNDYDTGVQKYLYITATNAGNTVGSNGISGSNLGMAPAIYVAASTNIIYYTTGYVSSGATPMQYALHLKVEYLGQ